MTDKMIENRVKKLQELETQKKALEDQAEVLRGEIKAELTERKIDELQTKNFLIRWKVIVSNRLDGAALKAAMPNIYDLYSRESTCRRFTIV